MPKVNCFTLGIGRSFTLKLIPPVPINVAGPLDAPEGGINPLGNGLLSEFAGVRFPSFDCTYCVRLLNPLKYPESAYEGRYINEKPPRRTVLSFMLYSSPIRGGKLLQSVAKGVL